MCERSTVVLFRGNLAFTEFLSDTWTFDGTRWTQTSVSNHPPARDSATMATLGNEVVLFGGVGTGGNLKDIWTFNGSSWTGSRWTQVPVSNPPPARRNAAMATPGDEVVLFGGFSLAGSAGVDLNDTWMFNGTSWTQVSVPSPSSPPARRWASRATLGNEIVLFGGVDQGDIALNDRLDVQRNELDPGTRLEFPACALRRHDGDATQSGRALWGHWRKPAERHLDVQRNELDPTL